MYFCQIMEHKRYTILLIEGLLLLVALAGCQQNDKYTALLLQADSIMYAHPDSALSLLNSIQKPQEMKSADRALYSLLFTQAEHKNQIPHTNDSLIQVAVDYYKDNNDEEREAKAYYYLGCVYQDIGDIVSATDAYLKALDIKPKETGDTEMLTIIYESLAECYLDQGFYDKAMEMYHTSYKITKEQKDKKKILFPLQGIGEIFMYKNQWDSAEYYYNEIIQKSYIFGDSSWTSVGFNNLAQIYYSQERYPEAYSAIIKSIQFENNKEKEKKDELINQHILLADIFIQMEQFDSARYHLSLYQPNGSPYLEASANYSLYELEKKCGRFKEAIQYIDTYTVLSDSIHEEQNRKEIAKLTNNYAIEKYKREITDKQKHLNRIIISSTILFIIISILIFLMIDRHRKKEYIALQNSLMRKREETLKIQEELNEIEMNNSPNSTQEKENKRLILKQIKEEKFHYSIQLFQKTPYYKILEDLMHKRKIEEKIFTLEEREHLWDCIYQTFSDTMSDLKTQCPELTHEDLLYCIFYLLRYSNPVIIACTGSNANALKSRKNRLKNKMNEELCSIIFSNDNKLVY